MENSATLLFKFTEELSALMTRLVKQISTDTKATVTLSAYSRGGRSRGPEAVNALALAAYSITFSYFSKT